MNKFDNKHVYDRNEISKHYREIWDKHDLPEYCEVCRYNKSFQKCHIVPVSNLKGKTLDRINHPQNLIALCPNHHWEFDHYLMDLTELDAIEQVIKNRPVHDNIVLKEAIQELQHKYQKALSIRQNGMIFEDAIKAALYMNYLVYTNQVHDENEFENARRVIGYSIYSSLDKKYKDKVLPKHYVAIEKGIFSDNSDVLEGIKISSDCYVLSQFINYMMLALTGQKFNIDAFEPLFVNNVWSIMTMAHYTMNCLGVSTADMSLNSNWVVEFTSRFSGVDFNITGDRDGENIWSYIVAEEGTKFLEMCKEFYEIAYSNYQYVLSLHAVVDEFIELFDATLPDFYSGNGNFAYFSFPIHGKNRLPETKAEFIKRRQWEYLYDNEHLSHLSQNQDIYITRDEPRFDLIQPIYFKEYLLDSDKLSDEYDSHDKQRIKLSSIENIFFYGGVEFLNQFQRFEE